MRREPWFLSPLCFLIGWALPDVFGVTTWSAHKCALGVFVASVWVVIAWRRSHAA